MRQVIGLVTKCCSSVITSLLLTSRLPSLGSPYAELQSLLPCWAAGTDTTGCLSRIRSWLGQETVALLPTTRQGLLQTRVRSRGRGFGSLPVFRAGRLVQGLSSPQYLSKKKNKRGKMFLGFGSKLRIRRQENQV